MRGGKRLGAGRKRVEIDYDNLEALGALHCTDTEICAFFGVSLRTIESRKKRNPEFLQAIDRGRAKGMISVRRQQMRLLDKGNATMAVWLGKQMLGQRDVYPVEVSGKDGKPIELTLEVLNGILKLAR